MSERRTLDYMDLDDLFITNLGDFVGDVRVDMLLPDGDTAVEEWSPSVGADSFAMLRNAPPVPMPEPLSESASAAVVIPSVNSKAAPDSTVVPAAVVPKALAWETRIAPLLIVVAPS